MATAVIKTYPRNGKPKVFPYKSEGEANAEYRRIKRTDPKAELLTGSDALDAIAEFPDPRDIGLTAIRTETGVSTVLMKVEQVPVQPEPKPTVTRTSWKRSPGLRTLR